MNNIGFSEFVNQEEQEFFQKFYKQHTVVGFLKVPDKNCAHIILKMKRGYKGWTPSGCFRDCGNYYIYANYSRYQKYNKKTLELLDDDCEDE